MRVTAISERKMNGYRIGELAKIAGIPAGTIRYYERIGLVPSPPRTGSGYRRYSQAALERLQTVRRIKDLGFTLGEISELLQMHGKECGKCHEHHCRAAAKLREIEGRIDQLHRVRDNLKTLLHIHQKEKEHGCTLLGALGIEDGLAAAFSLANASA